MKIFTRTAALIGDDGISKLKNSHVVLCGVGGVGSYAFEALVRAGVGKITVIDADTVSESNINRQLIATSKNIGEKKTHAAKNRADTIGTGCEVMGVDVFLDKENVADILPKDADFLIDAIDFVPAKVAIAVFAKQHKIPSVCCLGTGNRLDASRFEICDIYSTKGCPLARKMRYELRKNDIGAYDVLYSKAPVVTPKTLLEDGKQTVGSMPYVPSVAGLLLAQHVILNITEEK